MSVLSKLGTSFKKYDSKEYGGGIMMTSAIKKELIDVLTKIIGEHQERRKLVTDEMVKKFMEVRPLKYNF